MLFEKGCTPWNTGKKLSKEHKEKLSKAHKGQIAWNKGLTGVQVAWNKGVPASAESKAKMSASHIEYYKNNKHYWSGKQFPEESKQKMSESHKGQVAWNKGLVGVSGGRPKGMKHTEEAKKKMSEALKGRRPWNYIDGQTKSAKRAYGTTRYKEWRMAVYERDEFICQICRAWGKRLNCHHIKSFYSYPELRFDTENGITFCEDCHMDLHGLTKKVVEH